MNAYDVLSGGRGQLGASLGYTADPADVSVADVEAALKFRGYKVASAVPAVSVTMSLTKGMAINVALDEALEKLNIPHTSPGRIFHAPYEGFVIQDSTWTTLVNWVVPVANGYLTGLYALPAWAQKDLSAGLLKAKAALNISGLSGLSGFGDWISENPWFLQSVGDTIGNYGEHLTAQNVQAAIKANTAQQFSKDDATALVAALQSGGYIPAGKTATVAEGANMAAQPSWMLPALIGGGVLVAILMLKK